MTLQITHIPTRRCDRRQIIFSYDGDTAGLYAAISQPHALGDGGWFYSRWRRYGV